MKFDFNCYKLLTPAFSRILTYPLYFSAKTMNMLYNKIENNMGVGISAAILTGEVRDAKQSTFNPLEKVPVRLD